MVRPTFIDLNPFFISLDRCDGSCNTVEDLSVRICVHSKIKDVNLKIFNTIKGINESKNTCKTFRVNVDMNLMVENEIQTKKE